MANFLELILCVDTCQPQPNLSGIQKFTYLKAQLQGDAAQAIAGLSLTDANYIHSITLLEDRYVQPHKLVNAHMKALWKCHPL